MSKPRAQLLISLNDDGSVGVNGPIQDKILCYGLLECAREAIQAHSAKAAAQAAASGIIAARPIDPLLRRPNGNGQG